MKKIMLPRFISIGLLISTIFLLFGCTTRLGDFTVMSSKNVDVAAVKPGDRFTGESCRNFILGFIPLAGGDGHWETAMDKALERGKGDILLDAVVTLKGWSVILISQECVEVEGTVSRSPSYKG